MVYNEIGKTGMRVSNLSFGASSLGGVFHGIREEEGIRAVHTAVDNGINFIDVSPYYGHMKAETVLGKALKEIPRDKYYLSTKVGRYGKDGVNIWDYSAKRTLESVYESMERLNVDYIDLINVHDIEFQSRMEGGLQKIVDETLPVLVQLKKEGVVRHVGIRTLRRGHGGECALLLPLLSERHAAGGLSWFLRTVWGGGDQCLAAVDGTALSAWCPRLASGLPRSEDGVCQGGCLLSDSGV